MKFKSNFNNLATLNYEWLGTPEGVLTAFGPMDTFNLKSFLVHFQFGTGQSGLKKLSTREINSKIISDLNDHKIIFENKSGKWSSSYSLLNPNIIKELKKAFYLNWEKITYGQNNNQFYALTTLDSLYRSVFEGKLTIPIKIGVTSQPLKRRINDLSTGSINKLICILSYQDEKARLIEKSLHNSLENKRIKQRNFSQREWFNLSLLELRNTIHTIIFKPEIVKSLRVYGSIYE